MSLLLLLTFAQYSEPDHIRFSVIQRGADGFGVTCSKDNVLTGLAGRAAADGLLNIGDIVVSVDGEVLGDGERLIDRIRATPRKDSYTLGTITIAPPPPPISLGDMMKTMMASPGFRKMATKMVVGMANSDGSNNLLAGGEQRQQLSGPEASADAQQVMLAAQMRAQQELEVEKQIGAILDSDAFTTMVDKVVESPAIQKIVDRAQQGTLCSEAEGFHAVTACLLDGGLLRSVTDATCSAAGVDAEECERVHASAEATLGRLGLRGDGWSGWIVRQLILQPWAVSALGLLAAIACGALLRFCARRLWRAMQAVQPVQTSVELVPETGTSPLLALSPDVLMLFIEGWTLTDLRAARLSCKGMNAALEPAATEARRVMAELKRVSEKVLRARQPIDAKDAGEGVHQRILSGSETPRIRSDLQPSCRFGVGGAVEGRYLRQSDSITSLDVSSAGLDVADMQTIASALRHGDLRLDALNLSHNPIGDAGAATLATALPSMHRLRFLDLEDCRIGDEGAITIACALQENELELHEGELQRLSLGANPIGDLGCEALASVLLTKRFLRHGDSRDTRQVRGPAILQLGDTDIGDAGAIALAEALDAGAMSAGVQLWLASTRITEVGRRRLMEAASNKPQLRVCW